MGQKFSVTTTQLCHCGVKAAKDDECGCVPVELCLQKNRWSAGFGLGHGLPAVLEYIRYNPHFMEGKTEIQKR